MTGNDATGKLGTSLVAGALRTYAEFGRDRGGLLYVLQALTLLAQQLLLLAYRGPRVWFLPAGLLPLYLLYFAVRDSVWRRVYRPLGRVETERGQRLARLALWWALGYGVSFSLRWFRGAPQPVASWIGLAWVAGFWLPLAFVGRLPVDGCHFAFHCLAAQRLLYLEQSGPWAVSRWLLLCAAFVAAYGLYEHRQFRLALGRLRRP